MSQQLINRSPDLARLKAEGFDISVRSGLLVLSGVPYATEDKTVDYGVLVSALDLAGDRTAKPGTHVVNFIGSQPCHNDGRKITAIMHSENRRELAAGLTVDRSFSNKPQNGDPDYRDYYEKMKRYFDIISAPAISLDPTAAQRWKIGQPEGEEDCPFHYYDTNTSRAEIGMTSEKLRGHKIGIVGLGGTGSYVLDLVAKTPVKEIHLFDEDAFLQHNAFRSPGAPSVEELQEKPQKVEVHCRTYSKMHRGIMPHDLRIGEGNVDELRGLDFIFVCIDSGSGKRVIVEFLEGEKTSFIDVGMGIEIGEGDALTGIVRTTMSTEKNRSTLRKHVSVVDTSEKDIYGSNVQIADLNMLNAALAVIRWKKLCGYFQDLEEDYHSTYTIDSGMLLNEEKAGA